MSKGYLVLRHEGIFHIEVHAERAHPWGLGLIALEQVPRERTVYKTWLNAKRRALSAAGNKLLAEPTVASVAGEGTVFITRDEPRNCVDVDWIFELDLDHETFLIDCQPFFDLANLPPPEVFLDAISINSYGHRALSPRTPLEYRYKWSSLPALLIGSQTPGPSIYAELRRVAHVRSVLQVTDDLSVAEELNVQLYATLVGVAIHDAEVGIQLPRLPLAQSAADTPPLLQRLVMDLLALGILGFNEFTSSLALQCSQQETNTSGTWLRPNTFVKQYTHLNHSESHMEACMVDICRFAVAHGPSNADMLYAVACSLTHCIIARISRTSSKYVCTYTQPLHFLPSPHSRSRVTPGIAAIAQLGYWLNHRTSQLAASSTPLHVERLPVEIWLNVAQFCTSYADIRLLQHLTLQSDAASKMVLQYPRTEQMRLISLVGCSTLPVPADDRVGETFCPFSMKNPLFTASFLAVNDETGLRAVVNIGPAWKRDTEEVGLPPDIPKADVPDEGTREYRLSGHVKFQVTLSDVLVTV